MSLSIQRYRRGDPIRADDMNKIVDEVTRLGHISVSGMTMFDGPSGIGFAVPRPHEPAAFASTTSGGISAASGSTLGEGDVVLAVRSGNTVADGGTVKCYSRFTVAVAHPSNLVVAWDGSDWLLVGADCPE